MRVDQTQQWVRIIRRFTKQPAQPAAQPATAAAVSPGLVPGASLGNNSAPLTETAIPPGLEQIIASRIAAIDRDSPQRERHAFRVFLESVLLSEFGVGLASEARFAPWVEQVLQQMETDPELSVAIHEAGRLLLEPTP